MKYAYLPISVNLFLDLCKNGADFGIKVDNPIPQDTKFIRAGYDSFGILNLVLESEEFKDLNTGDALPELQPLFSKIIK